MEAIALLALLGLAAFIGRLVVRLLGWPKDARSLMRWGVALVGPVLLLPVIPLAIGAVAEAATSVPGIPTPNGLLLVALVVLGVLVGTGFIAWRLDSARKSKPSTQRRFTVRRRALPPAPGSQHRRGGR